MKEEILLILKKLSTYSLESEDYGMGIQQTMKVQKRAQDNLRCFGRLGVQQIQPSYLICVADGFK
jgi:hypothetical protein